MKNILYLAIFIAIGCSDDCDHVGNDPVEHCIETTADFNRENKSQDQVDFILNYSKWKCWDINHYSFVTRPFRLIGQEFRIEILNDQIVNIDTLGTRPISGYITRLIFYTIESSFLQIENGFNSEIAVGHDNMDNPTYSYERIQVSYDDGYGFPDSVFLDPNFGYSDDEYSLIIRDFTILE